MDYAITTLLEDGQVSLSTGNETARIFGLQALVQEVLIELLSDYNPVTGRGSNLIKQINDLALSDQTQIYGIALQAVRSTQSRVKAHQGSANISDDERLANMELLGATMVSGNYKIDLSVQNVSGQVATVAVP